VYINTQYFSFTLSIINFAIYFSFLSRNIRVLFKMTLNSNSSLINATTRYNMSLHLLLVVLYRCGFTNYNLLLTSYHCQKRSKTSNKSLHFIFYSSSSIVFHRFILKLWLSYYVRSWIILSSFE